MDEERALLAVMRTWSAAARLAREPGPLPQTADRPGSYSDHCGRRVLLAAARLRQSARLRMGDDGQQNAGTQGRAPAPRRPSRRSSSGSTFLFLLRR